jgi:signal transduction histidine kinase/ligand-binding sensor domain-containing protein/CheY-like chemotaxis protein/AraC-like DNA-binding protein
MISAASKKHAQFCIPGLRKLRYLRPGLILLMKRRRFFLLIILLLMMTTGNSQPEKIPQKNIVFSALPENLGLSQTSVNAILQDKDGFLWVGTWSGLYRYDGYTTKVFHSGPGESDLKSNLISSLFEDHEGNLWVGTHVSGLFLFDKTTQRFTNFRYEGGRKNSISNNNIWEVIEDAGHNLWIATENGLNLFDRKTKQFTHFKNVPSDVESLSDNFVSDLFFDSSGTLWVATNYGLNKLVSHNGSTAVFQRFVDANAEDAHNFVYQVCEAKVNNTNEIWFITKKGLKYLRGDEIVNFLPENKSPNHSLFRSMLLVGGSDPHLILGSAVDVSLFNLSERRFSRHVPYFQKTVEEGSSMAATALYVDRAGVLWVGTKKGLYKFDSYGEDFDLVLTSTFDETNSIITGIEQSTRGYWISSIGGGLFHREGNTFTSFSIPVKRKNDFAPFVQSLFSDSRKRIWMATAGAGIIRFDGEKALKEKRISAVEHYHLQSQPAISDDYIVSFTEDREGTVWAGTWQGYLISISDDRLYEHRNTTFGGLPIVVLHTDNTGTIWAGTRGNGVFRMRTKGESFDITHFRHEANNKKSLPNNFVNAIFEDHTGAMWFGTEGGLILFDRRNEIFQSWELKDGPANKAIVAILEDDAGKLWCSHAEGITIVDPRDTLQTSVRTFDVHDMIQGGFFYNNVCLKDREGNLLFGGSNGYNVIHPGSVTTNPLQPNVVISDFRINNESIETGKEFNGRVVLPDPVYTSQRIEVEYFESTILFEFAALDFAAPEKIRYAYTLEGFDKGWSYTDAGRRFASYTNLPDGKYSFRVRATNNDGVWGTTERTISVVVHPPWWKTSYAFVLYVVIGFLLLYAFRKLILLRANFRHEIRLERVRSDNIEKLNKAKLQFFTNISHEFRTPLTLILGPVQNLIDSGSGGRYVRDQLHTIHNNAQRLLRLINQLLDFRKAESGNLQIHASEGNLVRFAREIKLSFDGLAGQMKINFTLQSSSNVINVYFDPDHFEKILFNLLSNAFKHTPEGGEIRIQVIEEQRSVALSVTNTGKGIRPEHFDNIFQTFFSYDEEHHHTGTGIGLALVKSLVEAHHGEIKVESVPDVKTTFTIVLPLGKEHFTEDELSTIPVDAERVDRSQLEESSSHDEASAEVVTPSDAHVSLEDLQKLLIVEDNPEVRAYIRSVFVRKYVVLEAEDGKQGLAIAQEEVPDIIISDVMMPVMDGINLCRNLKSSVKTSHIPVILLTARTSLIFKVEGLETGADDYVIKPFSPKVLQLKVRNLLRTQESLRKTFQQREVLNIEPKKVTLNSSDEVFLTKVMDSVEKNMSNPDYSIEVLLDDVGMSRMQMYRKLKALTGQSANEFIRTMRLKRAAQLITQKQLTIAEITYAVGFNDLQYFRESFKKFFGVTPSEYEEGK